jgi:predicted phage-related endonuclease
MALTDKQRELRKGKFSGTDANAVMSGDLYRINDVYLKHTNDPRYVEPDFTENWPVRMGEITEPLNLEWAERKYGKVSRRGEVVVGMGSLDWTCTTLDGWIDARPCPLECKFTMRSTVDEIIARYQPQMHWQMMTTKAKECALSVIIGGNEPIVEFVPLNRQYARELWQRATAFWLCVKSRTPPVELPAAVPPPPLAVKEYDMGDSDAWKTQAQRWLQAYGAAQTAKEAEKALKSLVPADAKICIGHGCIVVRNRAGALALREAR